MTEQIKHRKPSNSYELRSKIKYDCCPECGRTGKDRFVKTGQDGCGTVEGYTCMNKIL